MSVYDGLVGIDEAALNEFVSAVHAGAHDAALVGTVAVPANPLGVTAIGYDIASVPVVSLRPSALAREAEQAVLAELELEPAQGDAGAAAFDIEVPRLLLTLRYADGDDGTELEASLRAAVELVLADEHLTPELGPMRISVPDEPRLTEIINRALVPAITADLQTSFLKPVRIPPLGADVVLPKLEQYAALAAKFNGGA